MNGYQDCPDRCSSHSREVDFDLDHLFHYGPITDDYGNAVYLPVTDALAQLLAVEELVH